MVEKVSFKSLLQNHKKFADRLLREDLADLRRRHLFKNN